MIIFITIYYTCILGFPGISSGGTLLNYKQEGKVDYNKEYGLSAENNIVDRDEEKFNCIADPSHDCETDCTRCGDFLEFCDVWLFADLQESVAISCKLLQATYGVLDLLVHGPLIDLITLYY